MSGLAVDFDFADMSTVRIAAGAIDDVTDALQIETLSRPAAVSATSARPTLLPLGA